MTQHSQPDDPIPEPVADAARAVGNVAETAARHPVVTNGARLGYAVSGVLHVVMGVLAVRLALGDPSAVPDQSGALAALAGTPLGWLLLGTIALGLVLLGLWQAFQLVRRHPVGGRGKAAGKAVLYLAMASGAVGVIRGTPTSSVKQTQDITALLLSFPLGTLLVLLVGLVIAFAGAYHVAKGVRSGFRKDLVEEPPRAIGLLATVGYVAKGLALLVVGVLFAQAAVTHDPAKSTGLDGALAALLRAPAGPLLVGAIGVGFAAYGVYSFARARYART